MKTIVDTKITDKWGVEWDEMETVRDFLQNFYDANPIKDISITIEKHTVTVTAPKSFDYQELLYLGSNKKEDKNSIGQYGEGWKAGVLNAMRNWNCEITFLVGDKKLFYFFEQAKIGSVLSRILKCEVSTVENGILGSMLVVENCTKKLLEEFQFGLNYFYYDNNPLFGSLLEKTYENDIYIYKSTTSEGYVFYNKLMRSKLDIPLVIVCNRTYKNVDKEIAHDRDRKAFKKDVLESLLKYVFKNFDNRYCTEIIAEFEPFWEKGHWLLSLIASTRRFNDYFGINFSENYYAKCNEERKDTELLIEMSKVTEQFKSLNYKSCPAYMSKFKMKTIRSVAEKNIKDRKEKLNKTYTRGLTSYEKLAINILSEFISELSKELHKKFEDAKYTVGYNEEVIGELKRKRAYHQQHIYLNKVFFTFPFCDALAILLHEWAHIYGSDGSRTFSDALTYFIALILKNEDTIKKIKTWETKWDKAIGLISKERPIESQVLSISEIRANLSSLQMRKIIKDIPDEELYLLLDKNELT